MRIPRVYTERPLSEGAQCLLEAHPSRHLLRVLRLRPPAPLRLFDGRGREHEARLDGIQGDAARVTVGAPLAALPEPPLRPHLLLGISKGERMDLALQKATELGVARVTPLWTERAVVRLRGERLERRQEHWRAILIGACEQSGRRDLPRLDAPRPLAGALGLELGPTRLLLHHRAAGTLAGLGRPGRAPVLLIGPEGGLAEQERRAARDAGFTAIRLGPRILRTETAPLAALAAMQALWGDFR